MSKGACKKINSITIKTKETRKIYPLNKDKQIGHLAKCVDFQSFYEDLSVEIDGNG